MPARFPVTRLAMCAAILGLGACAALEEYATQPRTPPHADTTVVGPPARLVFIIQPVSGVAGEPLNPTPAISVQDDNGRVVATASTVVTLTMYLSKDVVYTGGGITAASTGGIATF